MLKINKGDFTCTYNYDHLKKMRKKQYEKWKWIVLFACLLLQMFPYCVGINLNSALTPAYLNWTNLTLYGLGFTVGSIFAAISAPFIAKIFKKDISVKLIYSIGVIISSFGFSLLTINAALPNEIRTLPIATLIMWISNILVQIGVMIFSGLGINNLISKWWPHEKRGFALGLAFTGGSLGNIWMQQVLVKLKIVFQNDSPVYGNQYWTFVIFTAISIIFGLLIVIFMCRKPLPEILLDDESQQYNTKNNINDNSVSPLVTKKYPFYWTLAIGYLVLQMGTIHVSLHGLVVRNATAINDLNLSINTIGIGGTLFGVSCLIGNFFGGILNDKLGPHKSIFLAGTTQVLSIFLLMFSVKEFSVIYLYYILSGLSVYIYTSTPAFLSGRLYGASQSNNHMAILGLFTALGFAISNSISGSLTGSLDSTNIHYLFGKTTYGNIQALLLFSIICMGFGMLIVSFSAWMIIRKGLKGLNEYTSSKYTLIILFKYNIKIWFYVHMSLKLNTNYLKIKKAKKLFNKNNYFNLNKQERNEIINIINSKNEHLNHQILLSNNLVLNFNNKYLINNSYLKSLNSLNKNNWYFNEKDPHYKAISKHNNILLVKRKKIENKFLQKSTKLEKKLVIVRTQKINMKKDEKNKINSKNKLENLKACYEKKLLKYQNKNDWVKYNFEYRYLLKINKYQLLADKLEIKKQNRINQLNKKIMINKYIQNYNINELENSYNNLLNYYNNKLLHIEHLIEKRLIDSLSQKTDSLKNQITMLQAHCELIQHKKNYIFKKIYFYKKNKIYKLNNLLDNQLKINRIFNL